MILNVTDVEYAGGHKLVRTFNNGKVKTVPTFRLNTCLTTVWR